MDAYDVTRHYGEIKSFDNGTCALCVGGMTLCESQIVLQYSVFESEDHAKHYRVFLNVQDAVSTFLQRSMDFHYKAEHKKVITSEELAQLENLEHAVATWMEPLEETMEGMIIDNFDETKSI